MNTVTETRLRFFGGPLNEQVLPVRMGETVMLAPISEPVSYRLDEVPSPSDPMFRTVRYDIEKIAVGLGTLPFFVARVAVAAGYPRHRITDEMDAVLALCRWPWSLAGIPPAT